MLYQSTAQLEEQWGREGKRAWYDGVSWRGYAAVQDLDTALNSLPSAASAARWRIPKARTAAVSGGWGFPRGRGRRAAISRARDPPPAHQTG
ncbi:MAG TPA: TraM recognition domain-containing protein [Acetobacteraceae bacterium]|nr:TraM recognition domain-containing protein [Acetobacteraceae bacterium]